MTTIKSPLPRDTPLPCLRSTRAKTPMKSSFPAFQPILPAVLPSPVLQKTPVKKHVRFALKLEPLEDPPALPTREEEENPFDIVTKPGKHASEPWRTNGPLYGAYVEYLENRDVLTSDIPDMDRPMTPAPEFEPPVFTRAFLIRSKSPEPPVDTTTGSTSSRHLPRIIQRPRLSNRKSPCPVLDADFKQRTHLPSSPKRIPADKKPTNPSVKRVDFALPSLKPTASNGKVTRADQPLGTKIVTEYLQSKKLTEIITNPLPGTNNQINYICGQSILPTLSKLPSTSYHHQLANESIFFRSLTNDHFQPIIHPTH